MNPTQSFVFITLPLGRVSISGYIQRIRVSCEESIRGVLVSVFMESAAFLTGFKFSEVFRLIVRRDQRLWDGLWK